MKKIKNIKSILILIAIAMATFTGMSFRNFHRESKFLSALTDKTDAQFLSRAAEINLEEIHLGQLAQKKSTMVDVQELGKMMEKEHKKSLNELTTLANKKGIVLPKTLTAEANEKYKELSDKTDKKFNEEYCELMVKGHTQAIVLFETAS
jgi:putative membrane protein